MNACRMSDKMMIVIVMMMMMMMLMVVKDGMIGINDAKRTDVLF